MWDESRNSSQTRRPSLTALADCEKALAALRRNDPALVAWVEEGHPLLTEDEHQARFGKPYRR